MMQFINRNLAKSDRLGKTQWDRQEWTKKLCDVQLDARTPRDFLERVRALCQELVYINDDNVADGDWSNFLSHTDLDADEFLDQIIMFMENPNDIELDDSHKGYFAESHRALLLTFLSLLKKVQEQYNDVAKRHLDYFYRGLLKLKEKGSDPDQVPVFIELIKEADYLNIPEGETLVADSPEGKIRYKTLNPALVTKAQVAYVFNRYYEIEPGKSVQVERLMKTDFNEGLTLFFKMHTPDMTQEKIDRLLILFREISDKEETYDFVWKELHLLDYEYKHLVRVGKRVGSVNVPKTEWVQICKYIHQSLNRHASEKQINDMKRIRESVQDSAKSFNKLMAYTLGGKALKFGMANKLLLQLTSGIDEEQLLARKKIFEIFGMDYNDFRIMMESFNSSIPVEESIWEQVYLSLLKTLNKTEESGHPKTEERKYSNIYTDLYWGPDDEGNPAETDYWNGFSKSNDSYESLPCQLGIVFGSPILNLRSGQRTITVDFIFGNTPIGMNMLQADDFQFFITTAEEWLEVQPKSFSADVASESGSCMKVVFYIDEQQPAVDALLIEDEKDKRPFPQIKMKLNNQDPEIEKKWDDVYEVLQNLHLENIRINTDVQGLNDFIIQNDLGVLNSEGPFEPFGSAPQTGSRFFVSHPELKSVFQDEVNLDVTWFGAPENFTDHYKHYTTKVKNDSFQGMLKFNNVSGVSELGTVGLFDSTDNAATVKIGVKDLKSKVEKKMSDELVFFDDTKVTACSEYLTLELGDVDFQHKQYAKDVHKRSIQIQKQATINSDIASINNKRLERIYENLNTPYTPVIMTMVMSYKASVEIDLKNTRKKGMEQFYYLCPFPQVQEQTPSLLYIPYRASFFPNFEDEAALYIGLKDVVAPQPLSVYFRLREGSIDPKESCPVPKWQYLKSNAWHEFEEDWISSDTTAGLTQNGIIQFNLPEVEQRESSIIPHPYYWLKVSVKNKGKSLPDIISIQTQCVMLEKSGEKETPVIEPEVILGFEKSNPGIRKVHQPFPSTRGRFKESEPEFYQRASELMLHRNRSVVTEDYENLVLEEFPSISQVKCLPSGYKDSESFVPVRELGNVTLIALPQLQNKDCKSLIRPQLFPEMQEKIEEYLQEKMPPFSSLQIVPPSYVEVKVEARVKFPEGSVPKLLAKELNFDLQKFISPWACGMQVRVPIGESLYGGNIINFMRKREYVVQVEAFSLYIKNDDEKFVRIDEMGYQDNIIDDIGPDVVLISTDKHNIEFIE